MDLHTYKTHIATINKYRENMLCRTDCQRHPVILIKQMVLRKKINENIAAMLICTSFLLCVHGVEQLRFDCF